MNERRILRLLNPGLSGDAISTVDINVEWEDTVTEQGTTNFKEVAVILVETVDILRRGFRISQNTPFYVTAWTRRLNSLMMLRERSDTVNAYQHSSDH